MTTNALLCKDIINQQCADRKPHIGVVLGSGLRPFADQLENPVCFSYDDLPGFPKLTVSGHAGELLIGDLNGHTVACLSGRTHFYEGDRSEEMKTMIRTLKLIGCEIFINTNASGSLCRDCPPGELMLVKDHINFSFHNPLAGPNDDDFGPRFFGMGDAYDPDLIHTTHQAAEALNIPIQTGVYIGVLGPNFETPAEIEAFRRLGADCIGMSTVADTLVARHCGLKVLCIASISNFAAGMDDTALSHTVTLDGAKKATARLLPLLDGIITRIHDALN